MGETETANSASAPRRRAQDGRRRRVCITCTVANNLDPKNNISHYSLIVFFVAYFMSYILQKIKVKLQNYEDEILHLIFNPYKQSFLSSNYLF